MASRKKTCFGCCEEVDKSQFPDLTELCTETHNADERICYHCWKKYFGITIMMQPTKQIPCPECARAGKEQFIDWKDLKEKKKMLDQAVVEHYEQRMIIEDACRRSERKCYGDKLLEGGVTRPCKNAQTHDRNTDGRIFACNDCGYQECVNCDAPEHSGRTCEQFQAHLSMTHGDEEKLTAQAFNVSGIQDFSGKSVIKARNIGRCPYEKCRALIERDSGCNKIKCGRCGNGFCINCFAPFYGEDGVYSKGWQAHKPGCASFENKTFDRRFEKKSNKAARVKAEKSEENDAGAKAGGMVKVKRERQEDDEITPLAKRTKRGPHKADAEE